MDDLTLHAMFDPVQYMVIGCLATFVVGIVAGLTTITEGEESEETAFSWDYHIADGNIGIGAIRHDVWHVYRRLQCFQLWDLSLPRQPEAQW